MIKVKKAFFAEHLQIDKDGGSVQVAMPESDPRLKDVEILFDYDKGIVHFIDPRRDQVIFVNLFRSLTIDVETYINKFLQNGKLSSPIEEEKPVVVERKRRGRKANPIIEEDSLG